MVPVWRRGSKAGDGSKYFKLSQCLNNANLVPPCRGSEGAACGVRVTEGRGESIEIEFPREFPTGRILEPEASGRTGAIVTFLEEEWRGDEFPIGNFISTQLPTNVGVVPLVLLLTVLNNAFASPLHPRMTLLKSTVTLRVKVLLGLIEVLEPVGHVGSAVSIMP